MPIYCADCGAPTDPDVYPSHECKQQRAANRRSRRNIAAQFKAIDRQIEQIYYRVAQGVQIRVLDIAKIYDAGRTAALSGADLEAAIVAKVAELRQ